VRARVAVELGAVELGAVKWATQEVGPKAAEATGATATATSRG